MSFLQEYFQGVDRFPSHAIDLGAGDGRVVAALAKKFPDCQVKGVEINPVLYVEAQLLISDLPNATILKGDLFQESLADIDLAFLFAIPTILPSLRHVFATLCPKSIVVTARYPLSLPEMEKALIFTEKVRISFQQFPFFVYHGGEIANQCSTP